MLVKTGTEIRAVIFILTSVHIQSLHLLDVLDSYSILDRNAWARVCRYIYTYERNHSQFRLKQQLETV